MKVVPNAPLFRDPVYDGAADPTMIWNPFEKAWWLYYTCRRAAAPGTGVGYIHGTDIGIASSNDGGKTWCYRGIAQGLEYESGRNTYWAPEVIEYQGIFHMYVTYVRGVPDSWSGSRAILHYTSNNLWDWQFQSALPLTSDKVMDACVIRLRTGRWKMWYKDEENHSHTYSAYSNDLYHWEVGAAEITDCPHEGANVFYFQEKYWMITDCWKGLGVYVSVDAKNWKRCPDILDEPGTRADDKTVGNHGDVLVYNNHAYIFYFTHPEVSVQERQDPDFVWEYRHRRTSIQVAELACSGDKLICDRTNVELDL